jgi:hypothetical protein
VAGAPIGSQPYVRDELAKVVQEAREQAEAIVKFSAKELQCAALIHRATLPTKPVFLLRTLPPDITETFARDFNKVVLMSFKRMLGLDAPWRDTIRSQEADECLDYQLLAQPKDGGWGLFDAEETADICYVASHCLTAPLLAAVPSLKEFYNDVHRLPTAEAIPSHGHVVTEGRRWRRYTAEFNNIPPACCHPPSRGLSTHPYPPCNAPCGRRRTHSSACQECHRHSQRGSTL